MLKTKSPVKKTHMLQARQYFIDLTNQELESEELNLSESYKEWLRAYIRDIENGKCDRSFQFQQRAYYIATGESIPFLPKEKEVNHA